MADTLPDLTVDYQDWVDVYTETGIAVGTAVTITNKGSQEVLVQEVATKPLTTSTDGVPISTIPTGNYQASISGTPSGLWIKAYGSYDGLVNVQEVV